MKKIFTPLLLALILFSLISKAQNNPDCNAAFDFAFLDSYTVKFKPATAIDSPLVRHEWNFGDASAITHFIAPGHSYTKAGTYTVKHSVSRFNQNGVLVCHETTSKQVVIQEPCNLAANFTWRADASDYQKINFTNNSSPFHSSDSIKWTFGDGTSSLDINPTHVYTKAGTYNVCIRVKIKKDNAGSEPCVREICKSIVISQPCNLQASFNWNAAADNPLAIAFQNLSTPLSSTDSVRWTFGDGSASQDFNIKHIYNHTGTYTVCLRVKKNGNPSGTAPCVKEICKVVTIQAQKNCDDVKVNFTYKKDPSIPNKFYFAAYSNTAIQDQYWSINRLYNSSQPAIVLHEKNPDFVFHDTGYYSVCLKAIDFNGCVKAYCSTIRIERLAQECDLHAYPNPVGDEVKFTVQLLQPEMIHAYVYNNMNVLVKEKNQQGNTGINNVGINVHDWLPGLYTIKVVYGNKICYARFTKL